MTTDLRTAYGMLLPQATINTATAPGVRTFQGYDATAGLTVPMPNIATVGENAVVGIRKDQYVDFTANALTLSCVGSDKFMSGNPTRSFTVPGDMVILQSVILGTQNTWFEIGRHAPQLHEYTLELDGALTTVTGNVHKYINFPCSLYKVRASVTGAPFGGTIVADILKTSASTGGTTATTVWSNATDKPTIVSGGFTDLATITTNIPFADGDYFTLAVTVTGSTPGSTLTVDAICRR